MRLGSGADNRKSPNVGPWIQPLGNRKPVLKCQLSKTLKQVGQGSAKVSFTLLQVVLNSLICAAQTVCKRRVVRLGRSAMTKHAGKDWACNVTDGQTSIPSGLRGFNMARSGC